MRMRQVLMAQEKTKAQEKEMRPANDITAEQENFRLEQFAPGMVSTRRDPVKAEPEGTIILQAFRVTGYDSDCDGSLMARMDNIDKDGQETGWSPNALGIGSDTCIVLTQKELSALFEKVKAGKI